MADLPPPIIHALSSDTSDEDDDVVLVESERKRPRLSEAVTNEPSTSVVAPVNVLPSSTQGGGGEADECVICYDSINAEGEHRAACLKCGHIFGEKCISKWLLAATASSERDKRVCPQCKAPAKVADIRTLYIRRTFRVADNSEVEELKKDRDKARRELRRLEEEDRIKHTRYDLTLQENKRLASDNHALTRLLDEYKVQAQNGGNSASMSGASDSSSLNTLPGQAPNSGALPSTKLVLQHIKEFQSATARVMAHYPAMNILVVSQKLEGNTFGPFSNTSALQLVSCHDFKSSDMFHINCPKLIRDISINNSGGTALVAAMDGSICVVGLQNRVVVQRYKEECPVWSCAFNRDNACIFYCGLANGAVSVFDTRNLSQRVSQLNARGSRAPVFHLTHLSRQPTHKFPLNGLCVTSSMSSGFYTGNDASLSQSEYYDFKQEGRSGLAYSAATDIQARVMARSYRPDTSTSMSALPSALKNKSSVRHVIGQLDYITSAQQGQAASTSSGKAVVLHDYSQIREGTGSLQMSRTALFSPNGEDEQLYFAAADNARNVVQLWHHMTNAQPRHTTKVSHPVYDLTALEFNDRTHLAVLMEKKLQVYSCD